LKEFEEKLRAGRIIEFPYPHLIIRDVFSDFFYSELEKEVFNYKATKDSVEGFPSLTNFTSMLEEGVLGRKVLDFLESDTIAQLFLDKFNKRERGYSVGKFQKSRFPYKITPHRDMLIKLVSYMVYMPTEGSPTDMGTNICVPQKDMSSLTQEDRTHAAWSDFTIVKQAEYIRNTLFVFAPCDNSWHSVQMKEDYPDRYILRGFVFKSNENIIL